MRFKVDENLPVEVAEMLQQVGDDAAYNSELTLTTRFVLNGRGG